MRNLIALLLIPFFLLTINACQKQEEVVVAKLVEKKEKPLPEISQARVDVWLKVTEDIGKYIRKFSLEGEDVSEKRGLTMLSHSSQRTQVAFSKIFKDAGMEIKEFWNIMREVKKLRKYSDIKKEEKRQARDLDELIAAGREEIERLKREMGEDVSMGTILAMEEKIREFEEFKGNISPVSVGVKAELIVLWESNGEKINKAISDMWKVREREVVPYNH
ncbi:MAG: hypothetical protein IMF07_06040 [Proteobacteria bacterium]|nr:hypothetical protein [Pseudomonadota bacterium]